MSILRRAVRISIFAVFAAAGGCTQTEQITVECVVDGDCREGVCRNGVCRGASVVDDTDVTALDAAEASGDASEQFADAGDLGRLGDPCDDDTDCASSLCVPTPTDGYCTIACNGECPDPAYRCGADARGNAVCLVTTTAECPDGAFCEPGSSQRDAAMCGACNEGQRERSRVCGADCRHGAWSEWSACASEATCAPGDVEHNEEACVGCGGGTRSRSRECDTASCTWGEWSAFGACEGGDSTAECSAGESQVNNESCGPCGTGTREQVRSCLEASCTWTDWSDWSDCSAPPDRCEPGATDTAVEACGCGGSRTRSRACVAGCTWAPWGDWSECSASSPVCSPGAVERQSEGCGNCGTRERTRTCAADGCGWGDWTDWGGCNGSGPCSPGARDQSDCDGCSERVCNSSCQWGACQLDAGAACEWRSGRHWRCCGGSRWQYCLSTCQWSSDCATCSGCGC